MEGSRSDALGAGDRDVREIGKPVGAMETREIGRAGIAFVGDPPIMGIVRGRSGIDRIS